MKIKAILFICLFSAGVLAGTLTGKQIIEEEEKNYNAPTEKFTIIMSLIDGLDAQKGASRKIVMDMWLQNQNGLQRSMIKITSPPNLKGMGVLTVQESTSQTNQWLYLPDLGRSRKIVSSKKSGKFMGSDITFGDLEPEVLQRWHYSLLPSTELDGQTCYVVEAVPADSKDLKSYGYSKRIISLNQETFFIQQIEYFDLENDKLKIQQNFEISKVTEYWRANKIVVKNLLAKHTTVMTFSNREVNPELPEDFFSRRYLEK
jgi:outer membrane lipoprotein-sorting protein